MRRTIRYARAAAGGDVDGYGDKLLRYIPGEVVAFYLPVYALLRDDGTLSQVTVVVVALVGLLLYLGIRAGRESLEARWWYWVLSIAAFVAWAVGTSPVGQDLFDLSEAWSKAIPAIAVLLVPAIDELLSRLSGPTLSSV